MRRIGPFVILLLVALGGGLFGADLLVPEMELITRGYIEEGQFLLGSRGTFDIQIGEGYPLGASLVLSLESDHLDDIYMAPPVLFKSASISAREIFAIPLNFTLFTGVYEPLGNGDIFPDHFASDPVGTVYKGYMYFPEGINYDGIHQVTGTGVSIGTGKSLSEIFSLSAYVYQDGFLEPGDYSIDIRAALNGETMKLESFVGMSFPLGTAGYYRMGLLFFYDTGIIGEFLTQIGIPRWDPFSDIFSIDLFYFLFEPRVRFDGFSLILTMFWHPKYYHQTETGELGSLDLNTNLQLGNPLESQFYGGIEAGLTFRTATPEDPFQTIISPYVTVNTPGVEWKFKISSTVFPLSVDNLFEAFIGVKAEF